MSEYGTILIDGLPVGTEFGIDYKSWYIGQSFKGIREVPQGIHFVFYSTVSKENTQSPRAGFFVHILQGSTVYRRYDREIEELVCIPTPDNCIESCVTRVTESEKCFGLYPSEIHEKWMTLTDCIGINTLARVNPKSNVINVLTTVPICFDSQSKFVQSFDSRLESARDLNNEINFTNIPSKNLVNASPDEITKCHTDSSFYLDQFISSFEVANGEQEIIGELQFAFLCFLIGQVYDAFDHWKALVSLFTSCPDALSRRSTFFTKIIDVLTIQLKEIPEDYFVDIVAQNNFLFSTFQNFFYNFNEPDGIDGELIKKVSMFRNDISECFGWTFEEENEDEAPVVVEL